MFMFNAVFLPGNSNNNGFLLKKRELQNRYEKFRFGG